MSISHTDVNAAVLHVAISSTVLSSCTNLRPILPSQRWGLFDSRSVNCLQESKVVRSAIDSVLHSTLSMVYSAA